MRYAVDRFEEEWAVLQDDEGRCRNVERRLLPQGVRQGDVLRETEEGSSGPGGNRPPAGASPEAGTAAEEKGVAVRCLAFPTF